MKKNSHPPIPEDERDGDSDDEEIAMYRPDDDREQFHVQAVSATPLDSGRFKNTGDELYENLTEPDPWYRRVIEWWKGVTSFWTFIFLAITAFAVVEWLTYLPSRLIENIFIQEFPFQGDLPLWFRLESTILISFFTGCFMYLMKTLLIPAPQDSVQLTKTLSSFGTDGDTNTVSTTYSIDKSAKSDVMDTIQKVHGEEISLGSSTSGVDQTIEETQGNFHNLKNADDIITMSCGVKDSRAYDSLQRGKSAAESMEGGDDDLGLPIDRIIRMMGNSKVPILIQIVIRRRPNGNSERNRCKDHYQDHEKTEPLKVIWSKWMIISGSRRNTEANPLSAEVENRIENLTESTGKYFHVNLRAIAILPPEADGDIRNDVKNDFKSIAKAVNSILPAGVNVDPVIGSTYSRLNIVKWLRARRTKRDFINQRCQIDWDHWLRRTILGRRNIILDSEEIWNLLVTPGAGRDATQRAHDVKASEELPTSRPAPPDQGLIKGSYPPVSDNGDLKNPGETELDASSDAGVSNAGADSESNGG